MPETINQPDAEPQPRLTTMADYLGDVDVKVTWKTDE
jgi:hypothetical protein